MTSDLNINKVFTERGGGAKPLSRGKAETVPIGVFDSGVGGLTVLAQLMRFIPHEDILYLADTARVPYGGRPEEEIIQINTEILAYFSSVGVKMVIMACGTSSAIAYPVLYDKYNFPIISLIEPGGRAALASTKNLKIGVIATQGTVRSGAYEQVIRGMNKDVQVYSAACPLFVPLIEGGFSAADETRKVAREYLAPLLKERIDTLVLGCTHYPHLSGIIKEIVGSDVALVDPAENAVLDAKEILLKNNLANKTGHKGKYSYVTTGLVPQFETLGSTLLGRTIAGTKQITL